MYYTVLMLQCSSSANPTRSTTSPLPSPSANMTSSSKSQPHHYAIQISWLQMESSKANYHKSRLMRFAPIHPPLPSPSSHPSSTDIAIITRAPAPSSPSAPQSRTSNPATASCAASPPTPADPAAPATCPRSSTSTVPVSRAISASRLMGPSRNT